VALVGRHVRRARRAHRPDRLREPALGLCRIFGDPRTWPGVGHDCQCSRECGCHLGAGRSNYQRWWRGDDLAVCGRSGRATSPAVGWVNVPPSRGLRRSSAPWAFSEGNLFRATGTRQRNAVHYAQHRRPFLAGALTPAARSDFNEEGTSRLRTSG
jgi:hypothetical protein